MRLLDFIFESRRQLLALCHDDAMMGPSDRTMRAPVRSVEPRLETDPPASSTVRLQ